MSHPHANPHRPSHTQGTHPPVTWLQRGAWQRVAGAVAVSGVLWLALWAALSVVV